MIQMLNYLSSILILRICGNVATFSEKRYEFFIIYPTTSQFFLLYDVAHVKWGSRFSYLVEFDSLLVYVVAQVVSHMQNYSFYSDVLIGFLYICMSFEMKLKKA